jgi:hypothetical protein
MQISKDRLAGPIGFGASHRGDGDDKPHHFPSWGRMEKIATASVDERRRGSGGDIGRGLHFLIFRRSEREGTCLRTGYVFGRSFSSGVCGERRTKVKSGGLYVPRKS